MVGSSTPFEARIDANECRSVWNPGITAHFVRSNTRLKWSVAIFTVSGTPSLAIVNWPPGCTFIHACNTSLSRLFMSTLRNESRPRLRFFSLIVTAWLSK